ncbi:MAG: cation:proton antiporter regulatory subunit [Bacillota bacterium]|jgi:TrkA domain protein
MAFLKETELPGIGKKFTIELLSEEKLVIIVHDDGKREVYCHGIEDEDDYTLVAEMTDLEARQISGILGGIYYKPKALEDMDVSLHDMSIQWHYIEPESGVSHKSIGDLQLRKKTGVTIIGAIEKNGRHIINPGPNFVLEGGQTVVIVGEREQVKSFKKLICNNIEKKEN